MAASRSGKKRRSAPRQARAPVVATSAPARGRPRLTDRESLLDAAERAIRRNGPAVPLSEIAAEAGVTKPVLFAHVGDRRALVNAITERLLTRIEAAIQQALARAPEGRAALEALIAANLRTVGADHHIYAFVNGAGASDTSLERTLEFAARSAAPLIAGFAAARRQAGLDEDVAEPWGHAVIGMLHMVALWWLREPAAKRDAARLAAQLTELLWDGLGPRSLRESR
jgi:AcrR family transcriptional regulator